MTFKSAWWLPSGHLQTLWGSLIRKPFQISTCSERLELPDGDWLELVWVGKGNGPIIVVMHGLEGSIKSNYAKGILSAIENMNWRGVLMHFRNCSEEPNRLVRSYHAGDTDDFDYFLNLLQKREPETPIGAVGYSLGGNVLLKWLGEKKGSHSLQAAVAVSVPFNLGKSIDHLEHGFSQIYHKFLLKQLKNSALKKYEKIKGPLSLKSINAIRSIREFDDRITAPLNGFHGVDHYYTVSSCRQYLNNIQVPTLILHSKDDPFMPIEVIPDSKELSSQVELELSCHGGHVGFISGKWPWRSYAWLESRIPQFFIDKGF